MSKDLRYFKMIKVIERPMSIRGINVELFSKLKSESVSKDISIGSLINMILIERYTLPPIDSCKEDKSQ